MTYPLLENWRSSYGPLQLRMPFDQNPQPGVDWERFYSAGEPHDNEDFLDRLNADRSWGSTNPAEQAGSGIVFGHAADNLNCVIVAVNAFANSVRPDEEHIIRWLRYYIAWYEMSHDPKAARALSSFVSNMIATGYQLDQFPVTTPHTGLSWNGRIFGWKAYARAMQMKVARTSKVWAQDFLAKCEQAAIPGTGQVIVDTKSGIDQTGIVYVFHQQILVHGALACAWRLGLPAPTWVIDWMLSLHEQQQQDYYGVNEPPSYLYSMGIRLKPCTGPTQTPGPSYWSTNCCALAKWHPEWMEKAYRFGPGVACGDRQSQIDSMCLRGALQ